MASREFLYIVKESALGTTISTPVLGTDALYIRLDGDNAFSMKAAPRYATINYGGGRSTPAQMVADTITVSGGLSTRLYHSQATILLGWASTVINSGQTSPWTTTERAGDLISCSIYHAMMRSDGTYKRIRYAGCKVANWSIEGSTDSTIVSLKLGLVGQKPVGNSFDASSDPNSTEFPAPAETNYPTDVYRYIDFSSGLSINSSRTQFSAISLNCQNSIDVEFYESRFAQALIFTGRQTTIGATLRYKASPDDLTTFWNSGTANSVSVALNNGTHSLTWDFKSTNAIQDLTINRPLSREFEHAVQIQNMWDATAGTDFALTIA